MISDHERRYQLSQNMFRQARTIIDRSGVENCINGYHRGVGGREPSGINYTLNAVLVCALSLIMLGRTPTLKAILNAIGDLTPAQLAEVGMRGQDTGRIFDTSAQQRRERQRFIAWLHRKLQPLDSSPDQPAKRIPNAEHRRIIARRSPQQQAESEASAERLRTVVNLLIKGSIIEPQPSGAVGDLVADESIFDLAGPSAGLGSRPEKNRGATYFAKYYAREQKSGPLREDGYRGGKHGFGIGMTAITRIGAGNALHTVAPVILAADIHEPTSGNIDALERCIDHMQRNGLDSRPAGSRSWPRFIVDMGYSIKKAFPWLMLDKEYTAIFRYPVTTTLTEPSGQTQGPSPRPLGPIQFAGAFYCPAAEQLLREHNVPTTRELWASNGWRAHDARLRNILPFLMGTNSRPFRGRSRGRPRLGALPKYDVKAELVCPAVQGRVQCPLKPASAGIAAFGTPLATPTWTAEDRQCCAKSSVTVTLTGPQFQKAQWGHVPGSWTHTFDFEGGRALTEQRFSLLKSPHITHITDMTWGPRREPMVKILFALAIAATNHQIQKTHDPRRHRVESIDIRWRQLRDHLGHEPARTPPRT